jgi:hypothetical protein
MDEIASDFDDVLSQIFSKEITLVIKIPNPIFRKRTVFLRLFLDL